MQILSKDVPDLRALDTLPQDLKHLEIKGSQVYYIALKNGNHYILQTISIHGQPITFIDLITHTKDEFLIRSDRPGTELIISLQRTVKIKADKINELILHERSMNILYQPTIFKEITVADNTHYCFVVIEVPEKWFNTVTTVSKKGVFAKAIKNKTTALLHKFSSIADEEILNNIEQLKTTTEEGKQSLILLMIISNSITKIETNKQKKPVKFEQTEVNKIYQLKNTSIKNIGIHFSLTDLIKKLNLTAYSIKTVFPAIYGMTLTKFILEHRMKKAIELLHTDTKLETIAKEIGYSHASTFTDTFKNHFGCSPDEYKRRKNL